MEKIYFLSIFHKNRYQKHTYYNGVINEMVTLVCIKKNGSVLINKGRFIIKDKIKIIPINTAFMIPSVLQMELKSAVGFLYTENKMDNNTIDHTNVNQAPNLPNGHTPADKIPNPSCSKKSLPEKEILLLDSVDTVCEKRFLCNLNDQNTHNKEANSKNNREMIFIKTIIYIVNI